MGGMEHHVHALAAVRTESRNMLQLPAAIRGYEFGPSHSRKEDHQAEEGQAQASRYTPKSPNRTSFVLFRFGDVSAVCSSCTQTLAFGA